MKKILILCLCLCTFLSSTSRAEVLTMLGLGDSIGEGVQSIDANLRTQPFCYLNLLAAQLGADFSLPLIRSNPIGIVGNATLRSRLNLSIEALNLAVVGADVDSLLNDRADASNEAQIDSEIALGSVSQNG